MVKKPVTPYDSRTITLSGASLRRDARAEIKKAVWALIRSNSSPPDTSSFSRERKTPVRDVSVQTFYVEYPGELVSHLGGLDEAEMAREITSEMVNASGNIYEPYLTDKIGADLWLIAQANEQQAQARGPGRVETAVESRIIELFLIADIHETHPNEIRVVGRESMAVERARLQKRLREEPKVIASIWLGAAGNANHHVREHREQTKKKSRNGAIYILEGRNASQFVIGSHQYDDIEVPNMPDDHWFLLRISSPQATGAITVSLTDHENKIIVPTPPQSRAWKRQGESPKGKWYCHLTVTPQPRLPISTFKDAAEVPPTIQINGRVLPRSTQTRPYLPEEIERYIRGASSPSGITLEENIYLYAMNEEAFILDLSGKEQVSVTDDGNRAVKATNRGFALSDRSSVTIGDLKYRWESQTSAGGLQPIEIVGLLYDLRSPSERLSEVLDIDEGSARKWMLGDWQEGHNAAGEFECEAIFLKNPDPMLAHQGNLILKYVERDAQGRPILKIDLKQVKDELPLIVKTTGPWVSIPWPEFGDRKTVEIPDVSFIGEGQGLIFGTTYYGIKTSGTLRA